MFPKRFLQNAGRQDYYVAVPDNTFINKVHIPAQQSSNKKASYTKPIKRSLSNKIKTNSLTTSPAYHLVRDVIGKKLNLPGKELTEKDFTDAQLQVIDDQVRHRVGQHSEINGLRFALNPTDTVNLSIDANTLYPEMYGRSYGEAKLMDKLRTPLGQVETTLGDYAVKVYKDGYEVSDTYDFNVGQGTYKGNNSAYAKIRRWAGEHGHKSTDADKGKIKTKLVRRVNRWK